MLQLLCLTDVWMTQMKCFRCNPKDFLRPSLHGTKNEPPEDKRLIEPACVHTKSSNLTLSPEFLHFFLLLCTVLINSPVLDGSTKGSAELFTEKQKYIYIHIQAKMWQWHLPEKKDLKISFLFVFFSCFNSICTAKYKSK